MTGSPDIAIIGGGIVGAATAYYLGEAGVSSVVIERDAVGSHASGHAYGGLSAMAGPGVHGPTQELSRLSVRLYREMAATLPDETGVNFEYRDRPSMVLCFTDEEAAAAKDWPACHAARGQAIQSRGWRGTTFRRSSPESRLRRGARSTSRARRTSNLSA